MASVKKKYQYQLYSQDGTIKFVGTRDGEMGFEDIRRHLDCHMIELIPEPYYPDEDQGKEGKVVYFGDEEGRFNDDNHRNPHMKVLYGDISLGEPPVWDCVGDMLRQEEIE